jgi:parallel beta-helix repeat protein
MMFIAATLSFTAALTFEAMAAHAPCVRPTRAGTQVQGEVRVCPGRYRIPDRDERGVIIVAATGTHLDLTGVVLESGDSVPGRFVGIGVISRGVDAVSISGGAIHGYRYGVRLEGGRAHRVSGSDLSGSRNQGIHSTPGRADSTDRLELSRPEVFEGYGGGLMLRETVGVTVMAVTARGAQNGIALIGARDSYISDNDLAANNGWGIHLWHSSRNIIARNKLDHTRRCEAQLPAGECGAAAVLLRDASDSNTIIDNDLSSSSSGFVLTGGGRAVQPSRANLVYRNNASSSLNTGFAAAFGWSNTFLENLADSTAIGFRLDHAAGSTLRGNTITGSRTVAILSDQGSDNAILSNVIIGGGVGIKVGSSDSGGKPSQRYRIDDNVLARLERGIVVEQTSRVQLRGNVFDGVGDGLVLDGAGHASEVTGNIFLRASRWFIEAPDLAAGGNYWATADASAAGARVKGRISVLPWKPASAAGY